MNEEVPGVSPIAPRASSGNARENHMMESSSPPPWVDFLLQEMNRRFDAQDAKLNRLVTQETFRDERQRVNDLIRDLQADTAQNMADIKAEATARTNEALVRANRERDEANKRQAVESQTRWQWFLIPAVPVVGYLVPWILNGGLSP